MVPPLEWCARHHLGAGEFVVACRRPLELPASVVCVAMRVLNKIHKNWPFGLCLNCLGYSFAYFWGTCKDRNPGLEPRTVQYHACGVSPKQGKYGSREKSEMVDSSVFLFRK